MNVELNNIKKLIYVQLLQKKKIDDYCFFLSNWLPDPYIV